ncbi:hypothetical protein Sjap_005457 [Stephania japonica]|uniref:Uncharacterized protein n=1 Tax=Stephania japonica TaxID=461633 RepID=A0AAP0PK36_9MAGN
MDEYLSEPEETLEVSIHKLDIIILQNEKDEADKGVEVILKRPKETQRESKEGQHLMLVKPPTLLCIPNHVLEVSDELINLKEGMSAELPKAIDASFVVEILKGEGITFTLRADLEAASPLKTPELACEEQEIVPTRTVTHGLLKRFPRCAKVIQPALESAGR